MNKLAPKEPSMDEILSSIRQIIADDDHASASHPPGAANSVRVSEDEPEDSADEAEPLALSMDQIVDNGVDEGAPPAVGSAADLRDAAWAEPAAPAAASVGAPAAAAGPAIDESRLVEADDVTFLGDPAQPQWPEPPPAFAATPIEEAAPMPDPTLSRDIAEQLLEPATKAAVRHTFSKLNNLSIAAPGVTIEEVIREMLKPMLKGWLDENLPSVVERMVEKEIARISRGGS